jgi:hypothetical protein
LLLSRKGRVGCYNDGPLEGECFRVLARKEENVFFFFFLLTRYHCKHKVKWMSFFITLVLFAPLTDCNDQILTASIFSSKQYVNIYQPRFKIIFHLVFISCIILKWLN